MPVAYTPSQRQAINNFISVTNLDKSTAGKYLKAQQWNLDAAVNAYFSSGGGPTATPVSAKARDGLGKIFDSLRDDPANNPEGVGVEGTMRYLQNIDVNLEDIGMLAVSDIVKSPTMGEMTREGYVSGWLSVNCETLEKQKQYVKQVLRSLPNERNAFTAIYKNTFIIARPANQKSLPLEMAVEYWKVLFGSNYSAVRWKSPPAATPWLDYWTEFLESNWKKSVNRDMWDQTLKFADECMRDEKMNWWSEESAWPGVIDEFVEWVKDKRGDKAANENNDNEMDYNY